MDATPELQRKRAYSSAESFFLHFQQAAVDLQDQIDRLQHQTTLGGERADAMDHCRASIARLSDAVQAHSAMMPARDRETYAKAIRALFQRLDTVQVSLDPRPRFSFSSGLAFAAKAKARPELSSVNGVEANGTAPNRRGERIVPPEKASSVTLSNLTRCVVDFRSSSQRISSLMLSHLDRCLVLTGNVDGPVHLTNVRESVILCQARQWRMHDSKDTRVYLHVSSRPIIEDCRSITFAPLPGDGTNMWNQVDDFKWLKTETNPNWNVGDAELPDGTKAELGVDEALRKAGVPE
ncbi:TBCC-domain-containing protein [Piedraia hortae CBS 480.64]|uniref:TBCC-domain-containing protein n=1 Tax=Piedraia hortae CBS 480.64 TaxID=1314780 RepID=A0A6A7BX57_9PEZI|nr:TBCC-domain-containing protein [Piedraia hortae CBS 480.64]